MRLKLEDFAADRQILGDSFESAILSQWEEFAACFRFAIQVVVQVNVVVQLLLCDWFG